MRLEFERTVVVAPIAPPHAEPVAPESATCADSLLKSGIAAAQTGDRRHARELLLEAAKVAPDREESWMWLASISEYPEELLAFLNNALAINPENEKAREWHVATRKLLAKTFVQRAYAAREEGSSSHALQALNEALRHDDQCRDAWRLKADLSDDPEQKRQIFEHILALDPEDYETREQLCELVTETTNALLEQARAAARTGDLFLTVDLLDSIVKAQPSNVEAWLLLSQCAMSLESKTDALARVLEIDPNNAVARYSYDLLAPMVSSGPLAAVEPVSSDVLPSATVRDVEITEQEASPSTREEWQSAVSQPEVESYHPSEVEASGSAPTAFSFEDHDVSSTAVTVETSVEDVDGSHEWHGTVSSNDMTTESTEKTGEDTNRSAPQYARVTSCPYCGVCNDHQAFECGSCGSIFTFADVEALLSNTKVDRSVVEPAVAQMEGEWNLRDFSVDELTTLAVGHLNLKNFDSGRKYLEEASRLDPNNVMLSAHVNTLAIRLDEIDRQSEAHSSMVRGRNILVVDDSATVRKLISSKLEKCGHNVTCAQDGVEALERLGESFPDLVLLDITMPRMDGYEVCKNIRSRPDGRSVPVVMISGKDGFFDKVRGRMAGCSGYVTKPFGPETLMKALDAYLLPEVHEVLTVA